MDSKYWSSISDKNSTLGQNVLCIGLPKTFMGFFYKMAWKIPNEIFGQPNVSAKYIADFKKHYEKRMPNISLIFYIYCMLKC